MPIIDHIVVFDIVIDRFIFGFLCVLYANQRVVAFICSHKILDSNLKGGAHIYLVMDIDSSNRSTTSFARSFFYKRNTHLLYLVVAELNIM